MIENSFVRSLRSSEINFYFSCDAEIVFFCDTRRFSSQSHHSHPPLSIISRLLYSAYRSFVTSLFVFLRRNARQSRFPHVSSLYSDYILAPFPLTAYIRCNDMGISYARLRDNFKFANGPTIPRIVLVRESETFNNNVYVRACTHMVSGKTFLQFAHVLPYSYLYILSQRCLFLFFSSPTVFIIGFCFWHIWKRDGKQVHTKVQNKQGLFVI